MASSSKFSLITAAQTIDKQHTQRPHIINANITSLAESYSVKSASVTESVTHILAHLASKIDAGEEIDAMSLKSAADFLSGVEQLATTLPTSPDQQKKANTIRVLAAAAFMSPFDEAIGFLRRFL